jgi:hypothetical protein
MARRRIPAALCALALIAVTGLTACESGQKKAREGAQAEGLAFPLANIQYNVFITRELNPKIEEDKAYWAGPWPKGDQLVYGIFLQACNKTKQPQQTADSFYVTDSQGNRFEPSPLPRGNPFAYQPMTLASGRCEPAIGSVAQLGPTSGSMLLFKFPLQNTENRPLVLHIDTPSGATPDARVQLDL